MASGQVHDLAIVVDAEQTTLRRGAVPVGSAPHQLDERLETLQSLEEAGANPGEYGKLLFDSVLSQSLRDEFNIYRGKALESRARLRLRLEVMDPRWRSLWWECLSSSVELVRFSPFSCLRDAGFSRSWQLGGAGGQTEERNELNMLLAVADPARRKLPLDPIEEAVIFQTIRNVVPGWIRPLPPVHAPVTLDALYDRLWSPRVDILHLVAHGLVGTGGTALVLHDDRPVTAARLAQRIGSAPLQVVVLVACASAQRLRAASEHATSSIWEDGATSFAETLLERTGVAAVVAMYRPIQQMQAERFVRGFYQGLLASRDGWLDIDVAVNQGRDTIRSTAEGQTWSWAIPVLFWRGDRLPRCVPVEVPASPRRDREGWPDEYHNSQAQDLKRIIREPASLQDGSPAGQALESPVGEDPVTAALWHVRRRRWLDEPQRGPASSKSYGYRRLRS
jgi:CHAT domain